MEFNIFLFFSSGFLKKAPRKPAYLSILELFSKLITHRSIPPRTFPTPQPCLCPRQGVHTAPTLILSSTLSPSIQTSSSNCPSSTLSPSIQSSSSNCPSSTPRDLSPYTQAYSLNTPALLPSPPPPPKPLVLSGPMTSQNAQRLREAALPDSSANFTRAVTETPLTRSHAWTQDHNALLFNIALEKAQFDLAHNKRNTAVKEAGWVATIFPVRSRQESTMEEDKYTGEIPLEVKALATQFAGFPQGKIAKVYSNCFRPMNLYKLRLIRGRDDLYRNQIHIDKGTLKMRKVTSFTKTTAPQILSGPNSSSIIL